jgi:uncharacterized protein (DUF433 family)
MNRARNAREDRRPELSFPGVPGFVLLRSIHSALLGMNSDKEFDSLEIESLPLRPDRPPLRVDQGGVVRVGTSRMTLDLVVEQYENGMTPEDMVRAYYALLLEDAYAAIAYYLRHREDVRAYLRRREEEAAALQVKIEAERPRVSREELLARRSVREKDNALRD